LITFTATLCVHSASMMSRLSCPIGVNGRDLGIAGWKNMGMGFKLQMGMGMKSFK